MLTGESGTGKEVFASAIHALSGREGPLVAVNCGAIPSELFEREMFGHKRSAFTGAATSEAGLVQLAEGGTLFLDEVDSLPMHVQPKLLRLLQEKEYRPLGGTTLHKANVRIISATNASLAQAVKSQRFRQDLYYRIDVLSLELPPLRRRRDDIPLLAQHFLDQHITSLRIEPKPIFASDALTRLRMYDWPGNVRELQHIVQRAVVLARGNAEIDSSCVRLPDEGPRISESFQDAKRRVVSEFERTYIEALLITHDGNISKAARAAKKNRRAFWELLRKHSISASRFKNDGMDAAE
jgi:two-component system response regulator GlrR